MNISVALQESWSAVVDAYQAGLINSECTLHSLMYAELKSRLSDHVTLCEPQITVKRHGCFVPDIVVLRGTAVAAIVELKFVPHGYPVYELDLRKLAVLAEYQQSFPASAMSNFRQVHTGHFPHQCGLHPSVRRNRKARCSCRRSRWP